MALNQISEGTPSQPYLIRAWHEWCCDNGFTPYVKVVVDDSVQVPREYAKDGEIVLNIGFDATTALRMGNDYLEFKARFAGVVRDILVPIDHVVAIFARENGQGMAFPKGDRAERSALDEGDSSRSTRSGTLSSVGISDESSGGSVGRSGGAKDSDTSPQSSPAQPARAAKPTLTRIK